jgi:hypothetical protein
MYISLRLMNKLFHIAYNFTYYMGHNDFLFWYMRVLPILDNLSSGGFAILM